MKHKKKEQVSGFRMTPWKALYVKLFLSSRSKFQMCRKKKKKKKEKEIQSHFMKLPIGRLKKVAEGQNAKCET